MTDYKHSFFVSDENGLCSNIYYMDIDLDGEIYIKSNRKSHKNTTHISIHKSGIKHVKVNNVTIHKWKKAYDEQSLYVEHSLLICRSQLYAMNAKEVRTDCVKIIMPDNINFVHLILTRAPKSVPVTQSFSLFEKVDDDINEYPYKDIIIEERTEKNNYKLCAHFESADDSVYDNIINEEKMKILDSIDVAKIDLLKGKSIMRILEEDGVVFSPTYLELFFTPDEIERYKLTKPLP